MVRPDIRRIDKWVLGSAYNDEEKPYLPKKMMMMVLLLLQMFFNFGVSTPIPLLIINSPDGDVIHCIRTMDQIAFQHPLLKDHIFQEFPTGFSRKNQVDTTQQVWHETGIKCPPETISVRHDFNLNATASHGKFHPDTYNVAAQATRGHRYAIAFIQNQQKIYGTRTTLNLSNPRVEALGDFSLAQIWIASGSYETTDLNTIEVGWQVYPARYLDSQPRLFTFWTMDAYRTGCYSIHCPGFVQISSTIALEAAFSRRNQSDITIQIWKDQISGNWWLGLGHNTVPVGYWPAAIFTILSDHAEMVHWGGEVLYRNISGMNTEAQMGSGEFAEKGYEKAAYFCNLTVAADNYTLLPVKDFTRTRETDRKHYTVKKQHNRECGVHFYFGGPGPLRSTAVRETSSVFFVFLFLVSFLL